MRKSFVRVVESIEVEKVNTRDLYEEAIKQTNKNDTTILNQDNVYRWMVNSVRHSHSNYERGLKRLNELNHSQNEYHLYKNAVLDRISHEYPNLADECDRQKDPIPIVTIVDNKIQTTRRNKNVKRRKSNSKKRKV
jgi:hypothetical protein